MKTAICLNKYRGTVHAVPEERMSDPAFVPFGTCDPADASAALDAAAANKTRALGFGGDKVPFPASYRPCE